MAVDCRSTQEAYRVAESGYAKALQSSSTARERAGIDQLWEQCAVRVTVPLEVIEVLALLDNT